MSIPLRHAPDADAADVVQFWNGAANRRPDEDEFETLLGRVLELLGEDPNRPGLLRTPARVAASLRRLTSGYASSLKDAVGDGVFEERQDSMIVVRNIEIYSLCEHHMLPFFGRAHIAYAPDGSILGLSKLARVQFVHNVFL